MTEEQPQRPPATADHSLAELFYTWSQAWSKPLKKELDWKLQFGYAFAGSLTWVVLNIGPEWLSYLRSFNTTVSLGLLGLAFVFQALLAAWFAWLISYQVRACSPSRLFLEGLLFPGVAATLLSGSFALGGWFGG